MPTHLFRAFPVLLAVSLSPGCGNQRPNATSSVPSAYPSADLRDSLYRFDDRRCSPEQRKAIRAATLGVIGTDSPPPQVAERLRFSCTQSSDGWSLTIWQLGPGEESVAGGFTAVDLKQDFTVRRVVGGA